MKNVILFIIGLLLILWEFTVINSIDILPVNINLLLIYIVCISLFTELDKAIFLALVLGTMKDFAIERIVGINTLLLISLVIVIDRLQKRVYKDKPLTPLFFTFSSSFLYSVAYILISKLYLRSSFLILDTLPVVLQFVFFETLVGSLLFVPFKNLIYFVENRW